MSPDSRDLMQVLHQRLTKNTSALKAKVGMTGTKSRPFFPMFCSDPSPKTYKKENTNVTFSLLAHFQWFNSKTASTVDDIDEKLQILKYRAELNYFRRQYSDALTNFDAALGNDASQV